MDATPARASAWNRAGRATSGRALSARRTGPGRQERARRQHHLRTQELTWEQIAQVWIGDYPDVNPRVAYRWAHNLSHDQVAARWNELDPGAPSMNKARVYQYEAWPADTGRRPTVAALEMLAHIYQTTGRALLSDDEHSRYDLTTQAQISVIDHRHLDAHQGRTDTSPADAHAAPNEYCPPEPADDAEVSPVVWLPGDARSFEPSPDTVMLRLQLDGREVAVPLSRRLLIQAGIGSLVEAFALGHQSDLLGDIAQRPCLAERVKVGSPAHLQEILLHLREQWHALVKTDNLLGPRFALAGVLNQIDIVEALLPVLRDEPRTEAVGLAAQYAESAAWLYEDSGNLAQARHWTSRAMAWAYEAGDKRMLAWTGFRRAQQAAAARDAAQVIGLAQAACRGEDELASPMRAAIRVQEAYGHALDGDEQTAQRLLDDAHAWAASDTVGDAREGHGSYCTPSYIEIQRAGCWLAMHQPKPAIRLYQEALPTLPAVYQRDRAAALSRLAAAYTADGQVENAASPAHTALPVARGAGSRRIVSEIRNVGAELEPHRPLSAVAALLDDLDSGE